ncbi:hypothetical protein RJ640_018205 [Escallonia rubra]|uniref:Phospholipase A2 n=1 Tax=Escallonia rubra TaxID=112253 RepID=A0AA88QV45_9ASTE|nr:hypothetical protein RJ640_018205 [Escallonia rubra]
MWWHFSTMDFGFLNNIHWSGAHSNKDTVTSQVTKSGFIRSLQQRATFDVKLWGVSLALLLPWSTNARDKITVPTIINRELKKQAQQPPPRGVVESNDIYSTPRFRPYVSKVPWHKGARAFLSQLFPRYGHYCGPNWSSGKDRGSLLWDRRPIDWLDFCCYCHDIGYDSHDQAELLKADLTFLECLERRHMSTKGDARVAFLYKTMCISGLRNILIPYRQHLVKLQSGQLSLEFGWVGNMKWKRWKPQKV